MLELLNISKQFGKNHVLNNLSLTIGEGDLIYIHGINGCGKSTLFKIICDIMEADQGSIFLDQGISIGALIENPAFLENESMKYNLKFLAHFNNRYDPECIQALCQKFSLDFSSREKMKNYSVGMRQKVGIIQAIMEDQHLVLFDEPTRGLDEESIRAFADTVNLLVSQGKSVVIASHDHLDHLSFKKSYLLRDGQLIEDEV